jgi:hypothetical protein
MSKRFNRFNGLAPAGKPLKQFHFPPQEIHPVEAGG